MDIYWIISSNNYCAWAWVQFTGLHIQKVYTHTGTSSNPTYPFVGHSCIYAIRPVCVHHGVRIGCLIAILRQNAYMHEQITK